MKRKTLDRMISSFGISLVALLLTAGGLLTWAHNFVTHEVHTQLAAEKIYFPAKDDPAVAGDQFKEMRKYHPTDQGGGPQRSGGRSAGGQ
jgi:hypothetical protein